jgi:hypothetical protein
LVFKPEADGGLAIGVASVLSHYGVQPSADLASSPLVFNDMAQLLLEGEIIYTDSNWELLSEFYNFDDAIGLGSTNGSAKNTAYYIQVGYQAAADLKPYARVENLNVDYSDPFFRALLKRNKTIYLVGVRYDLPSVDSSIKLEGRSINEAGVTSTELATAWGFGF